MADRDDLEQVVRALVRVANGEIPLGELTTDQLFDLAHAHRQARDQLRLTILELNERGVPFVEIGARFGVHESTAYRWAYPHPRERS